MATEKKTDKQLRQEQENYESYYSGVVAPKSARDKYEANDAEIQRRRSESKSNRPPMSKKWIEK